MATIKALKPINGKETTINIGDTAEMDEKKAMFHEIRGNVEIIKTKELKTKNAND